MENRGKRQASSLFGGMGFYIALLVCVVAAGVVGYYALQNDGEPDTLTENDPIDTVDEMVGGENTPVNDTVEDNAQYVLSPTLPHAIVDAVIPEDTPEAEGDSVATGSAESLEIPVSGEEEVPDTLPEESSAQTPAAPVSTTIVAPLMGETAAVFSVDQLVYDATLGDWRTHDGIDICAEAGMSVVATAAGTVIAVNEDGRLGVTVQIEHANGYVTTYASLHPETQVAVGDRVDAGTVIGTVGNTSLNEAGLGAHLHFSVTHDGEIIDPEAYLPKES